MRKSRQYATEEASESSSAILVYYWIKNGALGESFRRKDIVFECFHNFLAFSQWGNTLYNMMARLEATHGDPAVRSWFEKTMKSGPAVKLERQVGLES